MGTIFIQEEDVQLDIHVFHELLSVRLAYVGGYTFFLVALLHMFTKCFVQNQLHSSIRKEVFPDVALESDRKMNLSFPTTFRRKLLSGTWFDMPTKQEQIADQQIRETLSYKGLYKMAKLAHEQEI